jgi:hypothetical protein
VLQAERFLTLQVRGVWQIDNNAFQRGAYHFVVSETERRAGLDVSSPHRERQVSVQRVPFELGQDRLQHERILRPRVRLGSVRAQRERSLVLFEHTRNRLMLQVPELTGALGIASKITGESSQELPAQNLCRDG